MKKFDLFYKNNKNKKTKFKKMLFQKIVYITQIYN